MQHAVHLVGPFFAKHVLDPWPSIRLSDYVGFRDEGVATSTLAVKLEQAGRGKHTIRLMLTAPPRAGDEPEVQEAVRLHLQDARELITALQYVIETAEKG